MHLVVNNLFANTTARVCVCVDGKLWKFGSLQLGEKIVVVAIGAGAKPSCVAYFVLTSLSLPFCLV